MKKNILISFSDTILKDENVDLNKLDEQLQIAFQILINKGYEVLVLGDGERSLEFAKKFCYIFQDENIRVSDNLLNASQIKEVIKNYNCFICFKSEFYKVANSINIDAILINMNAKNAVEINTIDGSSAVFLLENLNAGKIVKKIEELIDKHIKQEQNIEFQQTKSDSLEDAIDELEKCNKKLKQTINELKNIDNVKGNVKVGQEVKEALGKEDTNIEFEQYKNKIKQNIEAFINSNELDKAKNLITEYESIVKDDEDICSMKAIILIVEEKLDDSEKILKEALSIHKENAHLLYNLAYVYDLKHKQFKCEAEKYYKMAKELSKDEEIMKDIDKCLLDINL